MLSNVVLANARKRRWGCGDGVSQGIGVMKAYWNHAYKHTLSLTDKHCKQTKTAQAGLWRASCFSSKFCVTVSPALKQVIFGSETHKNDNTPAMQMVKRAAPSFRSLSFVSLSRIIASQHRFIRSGQRIMYR